ncbi:MAG: hypothetical protein E7420_00005 [Ruminococcaceae bacterium]|nr:hypothetical protein [Oscillospiraceae bacterium]
MSKWITAAAFAQRELAKPISPNVSKCTVKASFATELSGSAFRLVFAEDYGKKRAEYISAVVEVEDEKIQLTVNGKKDFVVEAGKEVRSDKVELPLKAGQEITLLLAMGKKRSLSETTLAQSHSAKGDYTMEGYEALPYKSPLPDMPFSERLCGLKALEVEMEENVPSASVAVIGDSITEMGFWIAPLRQAVREQQPELAVLNLGVGGNRLLRDTKAPIMRGANAFGKAALKRLDWDVLALSGVKAVIVALGINDIAQPGGHPMFSPPKSETVDAEELKAGFRELIERCHAKGLKVIGATITPFGGFPTYNENTAKVRNEINEWIRSSGEFDMLADLAAAFEGEALPEKMHVGDHLHLNPGGGQLAARQIDVSKILNLIQ